MSNNNSPYDLMNYYYLRPEPDFEKRKGEIYGQDILLLKDGIPTFIDFNNARNNVNAPNMRISGSLYGITIFNIGPGMLYYSVNMSQNEGGTSALPAGGQPREYKSYDMPKFNRVNLRAVGADTTVNLTMEL